MQSVQQPLQLKNQEEIAMLDVFLSKSKSCEPQGSNYNPRSKLENVSRCTSQIFVPRVARRSRARVGVTGFVGRFVPDARGVAEAQHVSDPLS